MKKTFLSLLFIGTNCALFAQVETTKDSVPPATQPTTVQPTTVQPSTMNNGSTPDDKTTLGSTGQYAAYSSVVAVPTNIQTQFTTAVPNASDVRWEYNNQWYRATYKVGAHRMRTMLDMKGNSWSLALPVTNGLIPDEVIERAYTLYGDNVYDINRLKTAPKAVTMSNTSTTTTTGNDVNANNSTTVNNNVNNTTTGNATMDNSGNMTTSTMNVGGDIYQVRIIENGQLRTERMNEDGTPYTEAYWRVDSVDVNQQNMNNQNMNNQNWNNNQQQPTTTDSSGSSMNQGSMNNYNNNTGNTTNSTDNSSDNNNQAPSSPSSSDNSSNSSSGTLPSSEPRLQK